MTTDSSSIRITIQIQQEGRTTLSISHDFTVSADLILGQRRTLLSRISRAIGPCVTSWLHSLSAGPPAPPKSSKT